MLTFNVNLPVERLYCPSLECDVYDYVYIGFSQPLVGTFSIPIGEIKAETKDKQDENLRLQGEIIAFLQEHAG